MFPSIDYVAGLFDGEGSVSFSIKRRENGDMICRPVIRIANGHRQVLELVKKQFAGTIQTSKTTNPNRKPGHSLHIHDGQAKFFLEAVVPHLIVKRNVAWILLCLLQNERRVFVAEVHRRSLSPSVIELRQAVRELVMKINSRKGLKSRLLAQ